MLPTLTAGLALATINLLGTLAVHLQFGSAIAAGQVFAPAAVASGFDEASRAPGRRNMLVVIVESMGAFHDPALQGLLAAPLDDPGIAARYEVSLGTAPYAGSTTAGEMRELCGTRAPYTALLSGDVRDCLPARLAAAGYATFGFHAYTATMFDRRDWWPRLGLQETRFHEDLHPGTRAPVRAGLRGRLRRRHAGAAARGGCGLRPAGLPLLADAEHPCADPLRRGPAAPRLRAGRPAR